MGYFHVCGSKNVIYLEHISLNILNTILISVIAGLKYSENHFQKTSGSEEIHVTVMFGSDGRWMILNEGSHA
jgi:hypothetical protein